MTTSFKTSLTPEEHFHMYGTLAPEQVAEFMDEVLAPGTQQLGFCSQNDGPAQWDRLSEWLNL